MKIIRASTFWTRESVLADPEHIYIFGDNEEEVGMGGQACIRYLRNAYGIPTKKSVSEFWNDGDLASNCKAIDDAIAKIPRDRDWVISSEGLGTGLAELPTRAPITYAYLVQRISQLEKVNDN